MKKYKKSQKQSKKAQGVYKKAQGLPIHVVAVIVLAIIILTLVTLYVFGVIGEGMELSFRIFDFGENVSENASDVIGEQLGS